MARQPRNQVACFQPEVAPATTISFTRRYRNKDRSFPSSIPIFLRSIRTIYISKIILLITSRVNPIPRNRTSCSNKHRLDRWSFQSSSISLCLKIFFRDYFFDRYLRLIRISRNFPPFSLSIFLLSLYSIF